MTEKIKNNNFRKIHVNFKTPSDFQLQETKNVPKTPNLPLNDSRKTACFANILERFSKQQANVHGKFPEVITNKQSQNMKRISTEIWKQFQPFSQNMPGIKKNTTREATISTNHKTGKKKKGQQGKLRSA